MTRGQEGRMPHITGLSVAALQEFGVKAGGALPGSSINHSGRQRATSLPTAQSASVRLSPLLLSVLLIVAQGLVIVACNILLAVTGEGNKGTPGFQEVAISGLGVAVLFAVIRPMIRLSSARSGEWAVFSSSVSGTMAALALAELAALGGYAYLAHYFGTTVRPVSFHHWLRAWTVSAVAVGLLDMAAGRMAAQWMREGRLAKRLVVYGGGEQGARFIADAAARWPTRLLVRAYFDDGPEWMRGEIAGVPCLGDGSELIEYVRRESVDEVVIALPWSDNRLIMRTIRRFRHLSVPIRLAPDLMMLEVAEKQPHVESLYTLTLRDRPVSEWHLFVKSQFDRILTTILLAMLLPAMGAIACLIKLDSPGPVLFRQKRLGFNNKPFDVLKFRTMTQCADPQSSKRQAQRGDRRVTRVGRFLRRSSLDELPQLFNVLRGEMSLVGPRPHPMWSRADELWPDQGDRPLDTLFSEYASRHRMKPGITGWAQICGCRGETETPEKMARRVEHDIYYIDNWSLWLDVKILLKTAVTALVDGNAY